jgi:hypothetical protein
MPAMTPTTISTVPTVSMMPSDAADTTGHMQRAYQDMRHRAHRFARRSEGSGLATRKQRPTISANLKAEQLATKEDEAAAALETSQLQLCP